MNDAEKLRLLAQWLDLKDFQDGKLDNEIQTDLRRIASIIDGLIEGGLWLWQDNKVSKNCDKCGNEPKFCICNVNMIFMG